MAEWNPKLAELENPQLLRRFGLFTENLDGFDQPGVLRSAPHTLGMQVSTSADKGDVAAGRILSRSRLPLAGRATGRRATAPCGCSRSVPSSSTCRGL